MTILALDTTSEFGSLALVDEGGEATELLLHAPDGFGQVLFGELERLLERGGVGLNDVVCFAAASGPGSFTGLRVGLAAVKGLAEAVGRPVVAVSNLQAMAYYGTAERRAVVLDARRGEVYGAVYDWDLNVVGAETVGKFAAWVSSLPSGGFEFVATDFTPFAGVVDAAIPVTIAPRGLARAVGAIAWRRFRAGLAEDPAGMDANYVRRSDAELFWKE